LLFSLRFQYNKDKKHLSNGGKNLKGAIMKHFNVISKSILFILCFVQLNTFGIGGYKKKPNIDETSALLQGDEKVYQDGSQNFLDAVAAGSESKINHYLEDYNWIKRTPIEIFIQADQLAPKKSISEKLRNIIQAKSVIYYYRNN
jgi:hypothetical protein